jgi:predicted acyltransferase (DUF342 family)
MIAWPFITFSIVFAALVYSHFLLAYRAWRISRSEETTDIDLNYVRMEDYFARSFRLKVSEWLRLPDQSATPDGTRRIRKGKEYILVSNAAEYAPQSHATDILVVSGLFKCLAGCIFHSEIYAQGDASIGAGTQLQSIAVDGNLTLGPHVRIARWADCQGNMDVGVNSVVRSRVTAGGTLRLRNGTQVKSAFAPAVSTCGDSFKAPQKGDEPPMPRLEIPDTDAAESQTDEWSGAGLDLKRLSKLSPDCWLYDGDLKPSDPVHLKAKLIIRGDCSVPPGSVLEKDIKSKRSLSIGAGSVCRGNVVADEDVSIGPSCRFYGIVHAGKNLRLCAGVSGGDQDARVAAFGEETLTIEENVLVHGKVASGSGFVAVSEPRRASGNSVISSRRTSGSLATSKNELYTSKC